MEDSIPKNTIEYQSPYRILEVGGGKAQHSNFVLENYSEYHSLDLRNFNTNLNNNEKIKFIQGDVHNIPAPNNFYDRVVSTCLLLHLDYPEIALQEMARVVKPDGWISAFVPHDPGALFRFTRSITNYIPTRRLKLHSELRLIRALDHRNHFLSIKTILEEIFQNHKIIKRSFGLVPSSFNFGLYTIYHIQK